MSFADEIDDAASKLAIGTTALQQYRYAMISVGGSAEDADTAIQSFTEKLGEAQAGGRALRWFEALGFTREQLQGYDTAEAALGDVIDRLAGLNKETERQAVSSKIGLGSMTALTREGQAGVEALMQAALDLGYVMDSELVKNGAEANQKFEQMATIIDVQMKSAFVTLAPVILELVGLMADLATAIADVADSWRGLENRTTRGLKAQRDALLDENTRLFNQYGGNLPDRPSEAPRVVGSAGSAAGPGMSLMAAQSAPSVRDRWDANIRQLNRINAQLAQREAEASVEPTNGALRDAPDRARTARPRAGGRSAEQRQREQERALADLQRMEVDAQRDALREKYGPGGFEENATALALATVQIEQEANWAAILALEERLKINGTLSEEAQLRVDALKAGHDELGKVKDTAILLEERRKLAADRLADEVGADKAAIDLLSIQEQMAGTARERYEIGRRILLAEQELERKILSAKVKEDGNVTDYERNELDRLKQRQAAEGSLFDANEQNRLRENFRSYGRDIVDAIESGRIGETIGDEIKNRLLDGALDQLFTMMSGGGGAGGKSGDSGFWGTVLSVGASLLTGGKSGGPSIAQKKSFSRASGGPVQDGVHYRMAEHGPELLLLGSQGQVTNAAATAQMFRDIGPGTGGSGSSNAAPVVNATYSPNIVVNGSGPEIDALRRELAAERANFKANVVEAVADAQSRRIL
ncbi:hypothetical protein BZG35_03510 [Brevundimonas sp. LM2]|nr:hypothetical protein BZG35_03510 [Brevundimonas sp. LM2]